MKRLHLFISGFVQGVGFRVFAKNEAKKLGISGWIRNLPAGKAGLPDGRVEAVFEGKKEKVDEMVKWCYKGNPYSQVEKVDIKEEKVESLQGFEIK